MKVIPTGAAAAFEEAERARKAVLGSIGQTVYDDLQRTLRAQADIERALRFKGLTDPFEESMRSIRRQMDALAEVSRFDAVLRLQELTRGWHHPLEQVRKAWESQARQLADVASLAQRSWQDSMRPLLAAADQARAMEAAWKQSLGSWRSVVSDSLREAALENMTRYAAEGPERPIGEVVSEAVARAFADQGSKTDPRFVVALVLSLLMFLIAEFDTKNQGALESISKRLDRIEAQGERVESSLELFLARSAVRNATIRARPNRNAPAIAAIDSGATVLLLMRRKRWSHVGVQGGDSVVTGWVLNKYLR